MDKINLTPDILKNILNDLETEEIISIIFLLIDEDSNYDKFENIFSTEFNLEKCTKFIQKIESWDKKLPFALICVENYQVLRKLGISYTMCKENKFNDIKFLNKDILCLYYLCKEINDDELEKLKCHIEKQILSKIKIHFNYLELILIYLLKNDYISIKKDNFKMDKILSYLIETKLSEKFVNMPFWSEIQNKLNSKINQKNKRLCLIINEKKFTNSKKLKERHGSEKDTESLKYTFKGCGFEVEALNDLTKEDMEDFLNDFEMYKNFDCIFLFIMSHGTYKETIYLSDCQTITYDLIRSKFYCDALKDTLKVLIFQCCKGDQLGINLKNENIYNLQFLKLRTDNGFIEDKGKLEPDSGSIISRKKYIELHSTVENFASLRHESEGSWFIQEICNELQINRKDIEIKEWIHKVVKNLDKKRGEINGSEVIQIPEERKTFCDNYWIPAFNPNNIKI